MTIAARDFRELRLDGMSRNFGSVNALKDVTLDRAARRIHRAARAVRLRQIDRAQLPCRAADAVERQHLARQDRIDRLQAGRARLRHGVPELRAVSAYECPRATSASASTCRASPRPRSTRKVDEALAIVRLGDQGDKLPGQLSGGQQQRVAIARAIVIEPPLVLMDEPLSNLDAKLRLEMRAEIRRIHELIGSATIYVTHDQEEALSLADRIVVMREGEVRQVGTPEELYARPAHPDVAEFMGYRNQIRSRVVESGNQVSISIGGVSFQGTPIEAHCRWRRRRGDPARRSEGDAPMGRSRSRWNRRNITATTSIARAAPATAPSSISAPAHQVQKAKPSVSPPIRAACWSIRGAAS